MQEHLFAFYAIMVLVPSLLLALRMGRLHGGLTLNGKPINPAEHWVLNKGDRVVMETAGGGGCGAPAAPAPAATTTAIRELQP